MARHRRRDRRAAAEYAADRFFRLLLARAFQQIAIGARFDRAHDAARIAEDADDDDLDVRQPLARFANEFDAVAVRQRQIDQQYIEARFKQRPAARQRIRYARDLQPFGARNQLRQILAQNRIVFDDCDACARGSLAQIWGPDTARHSGAGRAALLAD